MRNEKKMRGGGATEKEAAVVRQRISDNRDGIIQFQDKEED